MSLKRSVLLLLFCLFLSSCFEMEETYNLHENGSYDVQYNLNMSGLMGMVSGLAPDSVKQTPNYKDAKDTTFTLGSKLKEHDKKKFSADELKLLQNTDMRLQMKLSDGVFKVGFKNQGKSLNELDYFIRNFGKTMEKGDVNKVIGNSLGGGYSQEDSRKDDSPFTNNEYDFTVTDKTFARKVKSAEITSKLEKNKGVYDMISQMNIKMTSTIIINLPRPAQSIENPNAVLSADRKQFKLVINMLDVIKDPSMLDFKVNY